MGAWGEGVFENDQAGDWLDQLVESGKPSAIDTALSVAIKARPGQLDADDAAAALAAAEVVAAARGHRHADLPDDVKQWLASSRYAPTAAAVALCVKSVARVRDDSELAELWAEGDELAAWNRGISGLLARLAKPAKATKPRKAVAAKPKAAPKPSPRTAIAALKKKRVFVVKQPGKSAPNWCCGIGSKTDKQPLNDADMEHFLQLQTLEDLSLTRYKLTDAGLRSLAGMTRLTKLELKEMPITDACAATFERLTGIRSLNLSQTKVGDAVLEQVGRMTQLHELDLRHTRVTDAGIKHLTTCTELIGIMVEGPQITDESLRWLSRIPSLQRIIADGTGVTVSGLKQLKPLAKLTYLSLDDTALGDEACGVLASYENLDGINLSGTTVTGVGLSKLLRLKKLDWIGLSRTVLTDADIPTLLQFPKANIFVHQTKITAKGKQQIADSGHSWINV
ncbi:MAG: DUF4259 domain-containing protein [Planctomycetaceae bacterium]|nr:DUF4259 domain-containing protein [Planctomycetaceae bacterium]